MKQSKFSLADVLTLLTALVFGFVCFLSANFITLGNIRESVFSSIIITVLLVVTSLGAKLLKRTQANFKVRFIWEIILLVLFTAFMIYFTITPFSHYFVVAAQKQEIQNKLTTSITQAENVFMSYEKYAQNRENLYKDALTSAVVTFEKGQNRTDYTTYGFKKGAVSNQIQLQQKLYTLHIDLFPPNYSDTSGVGFKDVALAWLADSKSKIDGWKPIGIVSVANEVELNSKVWLDSLVTLSKNSEQNEAAQDFSYNLSINDVKKHFTNHEKPPILAIGWAVVAYVCMLLSWFVTRRNSRAIGASQTASYEVAL